MHITITRMKPYYVIVKDICTNLRAAIHITNVCKLQCLVRRFILHPLCYSDKTISVKGGIYPDYLSHLL